jgi:hypothetical protein
VSNCCRAAHGGIGQATFGAPVAAFVLDVPMGDFVIGQGAIVGVSVPAEAGAMIDSQAALICAALRRRFAVA